jgi:FdhD protein
MGRITARRRVSRVTVDQPDAASDAGSVVRREDVLAVEEPLEIRVGGESFSITMRTPGHDFDLATGFLVSEGVVTGRDDVQAIRYCSGVDDSGRNTYNVLDVALAPGVEQPGTDLARHVYTTSSCGVCGKASIDAVRTSSSHPVAGDPITIDASLLTMLPHRLRNGQDVFDRTGGVHAAALFDARSGELLVLREDVGRHNAVDKVVGWAVEQAELPLTGTVLMVSGRASFELVQKASMAGIPVLAAVSAPSSLAVELAEETGLTVVGFLRGSSMVVYSRPDRVEARR